MSFASLVRYALSDLRHRALTTSLNVGAVALAAAYVLVLGFYGASIHGHQRDVLEQSLPTKITATAGDVTDTRLFFSDEQLARVGALDGVAFVLPRVELSVRVGLTPERVVDVPAEGTVPGDPTLATHRLAWGTTIAGDETPEVVLSRGLFERLGGVLREGDAGAGSRADPDLRIDARGGEPARAHDVALVPDRLVLEVGRTIGGLEERQRLELRIAGLLRAQTEERVFLPIELLRQLDLWCASKIEGLGQRATRPQVRYPAAWAWAPVEHAARVSAEAGHLRIGVEALDDVDVLAARGDVYAIVERVDGAPVDEDDRSAIRRELGAARQLESFVGEHAGATVVVLGEDDPRWAGEPLGSRPDALRYVALTAAGRAAVAGRGELVARDLPVDADVVCDALAWRRLVFDARRSDGVVPVTLVATDDPGALRAVAAWPSAAPPGPRDGGWIFVRTGALDRPALAPHPDPREPIATWTPEEIAARRVAYEDPRLDAGPWGSASRAFATDPLGAERGWPLRWIPAELFEALDVRRRALAHETSVLYVAGNAAAAPDALFARGRRHVVADALALPDAPEQLWAAGHPPREFAHPDGLVAWGSASGLYAFVEAAERAGWAIDEAHSHLPAALVALADGDAASVAHRLGPEVAARCTLTERIGVRTRTVRGVPAVLVAHDARAETHAADARADGTDVAHDRFAGTAPRDVPAGDVVARRPDERLVLQVGGWTSPPRRAAGDDALPWELVHVPEALFEEAAWHSATRADPLAGPRRVELAFDDPVAWRTAALQLAPRGLALRPVVAPDVRTWRRHRVRDLDGDGSVDGALVDVVRMSRPTFVACVPDARIDAVLAGSESALWLSASAADDPQRFATIPIRGRWLRAGAAIDQVVLGEALVGATPGLDRDDLVGRAVTVRVARAAMGGSEETLSIPLEVVGIAPGERSFVPAELVASVELWRAGKLVYNDTRGTFESPAEIDARLGAVRGTVFAASSDHVEPVVGALRRMGYETQDNLAEQEGLRRLGRVLAFIVAVFVLGAVVNAAITVAVATMMNVRSKIFEIGILRAHGVRKGQILGIFASQGLIIGGVAFALAAGGVLLLEPALRGVVRQVFGLTSEGVLAGSPFDARFWWLSTTALAVAVVFSVGGVLLPAADACRLAPVEALRRRE